MSRFSRRLPHLLLLLAACILFAGACDSSQGGQPTQAPTRAPSPAAPTAQASATLSSSVSTSPSTNPPTVTGTVAATESQSATGQGTSSGAMAPTVGSAAPSVTAPAVSNVAPPTRTPPAAAPAAPSSTALNTPVRPVASAVPTQSSAGATTPAVSGSLRQIASGYGSPDDLAIAPDGSIIFGDFTNQALNIMRPGSLPAVLATGIKEPEGIVIAQDGALIVADQSTNRILEVNPSTGAHKLLRQMKNDTGQDGVDGLGLDPFTGDILVPDSPYGRLLRMSRDGSTLTTIASGFVRPTGAAVEADGNIIVVDEFGNAVYRLYKNGTRRAIANLYQPDDVVIGPSGTIYVNGLGGKIAAINPATGTMRTLVSGLNLPHGLGVDKSGLVIAEAGRNRILRLPLTSP